MSTPTKLITYEDSLTMPENPFEEIVHGESRIMRLSPSNRKGSIRELLADYSRINVPEVWLLDANLPQLSAYRFKAGALCESQPVAAGTVHPLQPPIAAVNLAELWIAYHGD